ncbi:hypothetical protein [Wukongibacter sp. M2B1]|uniref:hypothetical protein n=1 Tax=Wukongibacter sp. M2B1 TaxID=3088895 RepID=UPI003D79B5C2
MNSDFSWSKNHEKCSLCKTTERKHKAKGLCTRCYQKQHDYPKEYCNFCGKYCRVHKRQNGKPICQSCYTAPKHECKICKSIVTAALRLKSKDYICDNCYIKYYKKKYKCSICGNIEITAINNLNTKVCYKCYTPPNDKCEQCGRDIKSPYILNEKHICHRCYESNSSHSKINIIKQEYICSLCGRINNVKKIFSDSSVICQDCFKNQCKTCYSCKNENNFIYSYICALPYCRECYFKEKHSLLLADFQKQSCENFVNMIEAYFDEKAILTSFETVYTNLNSSLELFREIFFQYKENNFSFSNTNFVSLHEEFSHKKMLIKDFTIFLNRENLLLHYYDDFRLLELLDSQIDTLPKDLKKLLIAYKNWLISKSNQYKKKGWIKKYSKFTSYTCYLYLLTSIRFFKVLYKNFNIKQSTQINNHVIDNYLKLKPYDTGNLRHLLKFINNNKITFSHLRLPSSNYKHELYPGLSKDIQKKIIEQALFNNDYPLRDRVLILLMLFYGFTSQEIQMLNKKSFIIGPHESKSEILLIKNNIRYKIPNSLTLMLYNYLNSLNKDTKYIFPGRYINKSLSSSSICKILKKFDVTSKEVYYTAINNSMMNGIYQPSLLMKMFGIHFTTATRYYGLIKNSLENFD